MTLADKIISGLAIIIAAVVSTSLWGRQNYGPSRATKETEIRVLVSATGHGDFRTIQQAIDHAPDEGENQQLVIAIEPGTYTERLVIPQDRQDVKLLGLGKDPSATIITYDMSAAVAGGTFVSSTVDVEGAGFEASNLTVENSHGPGSQAVALAVHSDRAVLRNCRLIGWQDTLYAASGRQFYDHCYISGAVDFIFGNARAVFDHCEIHSVGPGYITAESRTRPDGLGGFVFSHSRLTADESANPVYLGRPWRPYARVVFLNTFLGPHIDPAGWREWHPGETQSLETAYYAEYNSTGPGGLSAHREPHARLLTASQAEQFDTKRFLSSPNDWDPTQVE